MPAIFIFLLISLLTAGCVHWRQATYDSRTIIVQTYDLFNQLSPSTLSEKSWKGDWIFRRARLELIDSQLRALKPDLLLCQSAMHRVGSPSDGDKYILQAGTLAEYDWYGMPFRQDEISQEEESLAIAVSFPLQVDRARTGLVRSQIQEEENFLGMAVVDLAGQPALVVNADLEKSSGFLNQAARSILEAASRLKICSERILVAGKVPFGSETPEYLEFMNLLGLKDSSQGFCELEVNCHTATPLNNLYVAVRGETRPTREDRLLVHESAIVYSAEPNLKEFLEAGEFGSTYGLDQLYGSYKFGWTAQLRLARCSN